MSYDLLKILHIISATLLVTSIIMSVKVWKKSKASSSAAMMHTLQTQTGISIVPLAILQLASGFTMISLRHYDVSQLWITGSITSFIVAVVSWLGFFCLLHRNQPRLQSSLLVICALALVCMVFLMVSKL